MITFSRFQREELERNLCHLLYHMGRATAPVWRMRAARPVRTTVTSSTGSLYFAWSCSPDSGDRSVCVCGAVLGQTFAESLEKYDLFVPDDG